MKYETPTHVRLNPKLIEIAERILDQHPDRRRSVSEAIRIALVYWSQHNPDTSHDERKERKND